MNRKMGMLALIGGLALLATACTEKGDTIVQTGNVQQTGVSATGTGEAVGKPDVMVLTIGVSAQRTSIEAAREAAAAAQKGVIDALKANGVAEKDIQTVQFSVSPQYDYSSSRGPRLTGYVVSNVVSAKVRNLDKAGSAIDAATQAGGNDAIVQGVWFGIDDPTDLQKQAREQAVKKAHDQAEQLASNGGARLGKLLSISESSGYVPYSRDLAVPSVAGAEAQTTTPIQTGELKITITVNVLYALE